MTFSPEDAYSSNVPVPDESEFDTDGLELVPMTGAEEVVEEVYTAEKQAADADRYRVNPESEQVSHAGERPSSELFAQADSVADRERTEQVSKAENLVDLIMTLTSWGETIPHPGGGRVNVHNVINHIKRYMSGERKISFAEQRSDDPLFSDITRTNGIRDKVQSIFEKQGYTYTAANGVKRNILE